MIVNNVLGLFNYLQSALQHLLGQKHQSHRFKETEETDEKKG